MFETDGHEYDIVKNAVANTSDDGLFLEIGTRLGGSTKIIIDEILKKHSGAPRLYALALYVLQRSPLQRSASSIQLFGLMGG